MQSPKSLRMKPLAKDCIPAGCLCIVIWTIILPSVASNGMVPASVDRCAAPDSVELIPITSLKGLCPGKVIMFFCQIYNSSVLTWHSEEYINDFLTLSIRSNLGNMIRDPMYMDTVATYNDSVIVNGTVLSGKSLLAIELRAEVPTATITCHSENHCSSSKTFLLLDTPDAPEGVTAEELGDSDPDDNSCKLFIQLSPPRNIDPIHIDRYLVQHPLGNLTLLCEMGVVAVPNCTREVRLSISAINICGEVGASANDIEPRFRPTIPNNSTTTSAPTTESSSTTTSVPTTESSSTTTSVPTTESSSTSVYGSTSAPQLSPSSALCVIILLITSFGAYLIPF